MITDLMAQDWSVIIPLAPLPLGSWLIHRHFNPSRNTVLQEPHQREERP